MEGKRDMASAYDFIIVGGGTAGCLLANKLSSSAAKPSVLVLEAGCTPEGEYLREPFHRYSAAILRTDLDHGYVTEPEPGLNGRMVPYQRGKGLGGSSIMNFGVYLYGSSEDYNRWADIVGDDDWNWEHTKERYHAMETYDFEGSSEYSNLANPSTSEHGTTGLLKVGLPPLLEKGVGPQMEALIEAGEKINLDVNSGDPTGLSVFPFSYSTEGRTTSAIAYLTDSPSNLEVWTSAKAVKLLFEGDKVLGVVTEDGRQALSRKEVILTAGAIDSPWLLLLNGIGPKSELKAHGIEVKNDLSGVGKRLNDHVLTFLTAEVDGSFNDRYAFESNSELLSEADNHWKRDQTGAFALHQSSLYGGFHKVPGLHDTEDFKALPRDFQTYLNKPAVPDYEFISNLPLWPPGTKISEGNTYMTTFPFLMNPQSEGSVTLRSADVSDKPVISFNYLTHPYDILCFREAIRATWTKLMQNPYIKASVRKEMLGPKSMSDADIDDYARQTAGPVWHANGSVRMGKKEDGACVDSAGRVFGVTRLRVADLSVCPVTTNNHTQSTAYLVGATIGDKIVKQWALDKA